MAVTPSNPRERRIWANGYGDALRDIASRIAEGTDTRDALDRALTWISDNGGPTARDILKAATVTTPTRCNCVGFCHCDTTREA